MTKRHFRRREKGIFILEFLLDFRVVESIENWGGGFRGRGRGVLFEDFHLSGHLGHLLRQEEFLVFDGHQSLFQQLILLLDGRFLALELFHFLSLPLPRGLSGLAVSENTLDAPLLLFIVCFGPLSVINISTWTIDVEDDFND